MRGLIPFDHPEFGQVRARLDESGEPWWVAVDICRVLELANPRDALSSLKDDEKITVANADGNPRAGIPHQMNLVNEPGLYRLIFKSRVKRAEKFQHWVFHDVIPSIRKTGTYALPNVARRREPARLTMAEKKAGGSLLGFLYPDLGNKVFAEHPNFFSLRPREQMAILNAAYPPALAE